MNPTRLWRELEVPAPVIATLERLGPAAWVVGGAIRDRLLREPSVCDWDIATALEPARFCDRFPDASRRDLRFGGLTFERDGLSITVTTLREDGAYLDRRRPDHVRFVLDPRIDAARRDFTLNSVFARADEVIDPFGGLDDLSARRLRVIGDALGRLREDPLRIWRGLRMLARFGFTPEPNTDAAMRSLARNAVDEVAAPRRFAEFDAALVRSRSGGDAVRSLCEYELATGIVAGTDYGIDRWRAAADRLDRQASLAGEVCDVQALRWATLLWDHPRPGHALTELGAPRALRNACDATIECGKALLQRASDPDRRESRPASEEVFWAGLTLARAASAPASELVRSLDAIATSGPPGALLRGTDVLDLGIAPGPRVGALLAAARSALPAHADRDTALRILARLVAEGRTAGGREVKGEGTPVDK